MTPRREITITVLLCVVAGGLALLAAGRPWAELDGTQLAPAPNRPDAVVRITEHLTGNDLRPETTAAGLVVLAASLGIIAGGRWVRAATAVALIAVLPMLLLAVPLRRTAEVASQPEIRGVVARSFPDGHFSVAPTSWPLVAGAAGLLTMVAATLVLTRWRTWPAMSRRYDRPVARPIEDEAALWDALDRGEDPTSTPS